MENSIIGFIIGIIFGACLVLSGLTDPDKIINAFKLKDFHVIRTIAVFILVGMFGTWILVIIGAANMHIKPAAIPMVIVGGALVGLGVGLTGYCPGTSLASAGSGRIDALTAIIGMYLGAHVYILIYPLIVMPLEKVFNYGQVTLPQITNTSLAPWVISIFTAGSLVLFFTRSREAGNDKQHQAGDSKIEKGIFNKNSPKPIPKEKVKDITLSIFQATRLLRMWKNLLFILITLCLIFLQVCFWLTYTGKIEITRKTNSDEVIIQNITLGNSSVGTEAEDAINETENKGFFDKNIPFEKIIPILHFINVILVFAPMLYVLIIFLCLSASFGGGLGGISQISRGFISAMVMFVLLFPWQNIFSSSLIGAVYSPNELYKWHLSDIHNTFGIVLIFLRFTGYWILVLLLLMKSQIHCWLWSKTIFLKLRKVY